MSSSVLTRNKVLVLNRGWHAIAFISLQRAIGLVSSSYKSGEPKARIIDATQEFKVYTWADWSDLIPSQEEEKIRSGSRTHRVPDTILLSRFNKLPEQQVKFNRSTIYRRDNNTCQYCGAKPGTKELSIDHLLPKSKGGLTTWQNCILSCTVCNRAKSDIVPKQVGNEFTVFFRNNNRTWQVTIKEPKKPRYNLYPGSMARRCKSWESFIGEAYWATELQNDNE